MLYRQRKKKASTGVTDASKITNEDNRCQPRMGKFSPPPFPTTQHAPTGAVRGQERVLFFTVPGTALSTYLQARAGTSSYQPPRVHHPSLRSLKQILAASESLERHVKADGRPYPRSFGYSSSGMGPNHFYFQ